MALKILQSGVNPLGQFDAVDSVAANCLGGEVITWTFPDITGSDKHSVDVNDGYVGTTTKWRPALTFNLSNGIRPLMLCDEGTAGYGTLFGQVVGGVSGQQVTGGAVLGPHTAAGSGKLTAYDKPGLYAVTLDACDTTASTGLQPTNSTLRGGAALYATSAGLLTPAVGSSFESVVIGRFLEFNTNGSLVTTPQSLVAATNSPVGNVSSVKLNPFTVATFYFHPDQT